MIEVKEGLIAEAAGCAGRLLTMSRQLSWQQMQVWPTTTGMSPHFLDRAGMGIRLF